MGERQLYLESLGCSRNTVDSEVMLGRLKAAGWTITQDPTTAETIIINTCSFIEPANNESIDAILELAKLKRKGGGRRLIVAGCLPQRFKAEIEDALPEVDVFIGTGAFDKVVAAADGRLDTTKCVFPDPDSLSVQTEVPSRIRSYPHMAYLKIAEGCNRRCTYCIIPRLRGKQRSRPMEAVVSEARSFIASGVKELILVAQDTTAYGTDLIPPVELGRLLEKLSDISEGVWIRVLYGHPESVTDDFIKKVAALPAVCTYFDIPIQHVNNDILKRMGRNYTEADLYRLYDRIRSLAPDAAIRTTLITGFPGEDDTCCRQLLEFMEKIRFDHLGVFVYSDSEDLPSHRLSGHVPKRVAEARYDLLMSRQREISLENNKNHIHKRYTVLVDGMAAESVFSGRTYFQAPEVDGLTYVSFSEFLTPGCFVETEITDALEYDLVGDPLWAT